MLDTNKLQPLTEDDVRRIVRAEIAAWEQEVCPVLDGPTERMRDIMQSAAMSEGEG
jgi:hypothetical protein